MDIRHGYPSEAIIIKKQRGSPSEGVGSDFPMDKGLGSDLSMDKGLGSPSKKQRSVEAWREIGRCQFNNLPIDKWLRSPSEKQRSVEGSSKISVGHLPMDGSLSEATKRSVEVGCRKIGIMSRKRDYDKGQDEYKLYVVEVDLGKQSEGPHGCKGCTSCYRVRNYNCYRGRNDNNSCVERKWVRRFTNLDPLIQFQLPPCPSLSGFCILNNKLYVFEGGGDGDYAKSIYKSDLPKEILGGGKRKGKGESIDVTQMQTCVMNKAKHLPIALASPGGRKILVFPSLVRPGEVGAFELYDSIDNKCEVVPPIPTDRDPSLVKRPYGTGTGSSMRDIRFSFISDARFWLEVPNHGRYILDIHKLEWEYLGRPLIPWDWNWAPTDTSFEAIEDTGYAMNFDSVHYRPDLFLKEDESEISYDLLLKQKKKSEISYDLLLKQKKKSTLVYSEGSRCFGERSRDMKLINYNLKDQVCHAATLRVYEKRLLIDLHRICLPTLDTTHAQSVGLKIKGLDEGLDDEDKVDRMYFSLCCL